MLEAVLGRLARASRAALRTIARCAEPKGAAELLASVPAAPSSAELCAWRGRVDALALRTRLSDAHLYQRLAPPGARSQRLFDALEQARVESLPPASLPGLRVNLCAWHARETQRDGAALIRAARGRWGAPVAPGADPASDAPVSVPILAALDAMAGLCDDQASFGIAALDLLRLVDRDVGQMRHEQVQRDSSADAPGHPGSDVGSADTADPRTRRGNSEDGKGVADESTGAQSYRVYTKAFDRTIDAGELLRTRPVSTGSSPHWEQVEHSRARFHRWAMRLQRYLQVQALRSWHFDQEEGQIDAARLARVLTNPLTARPFKRQSAAPWREAAVTLLVDCSGSMRGAVMATAVACAQVLVPVLERCGVCVEMLGFTTREWRGGAARAQWVMAGRPPHPGRLTDLLHIVFKSGDQPWRRASSGLASLLQDANLKENVDGEALLWAHGRLLRRPERRRILQVISDGAPCDEATLNANDPAYLDRHLRGVIAAIESRSPVELLAIGIGHDVGRHYARAFTVPGSANLGEAIVTQLAALLGDPARATAHGRSVRVKGKSWSSIW